jgi:hypothetical protein
VSARGGQFREEERNTALNHNPERRLQARPPTGDRIALHLDRTSGLDPLGFHALRVGVSIASGSTRSTNQRGKRWLSPAYARHARYLPPTCCYAEADFLVQLAGFTRADLDRACLWRCAIMVPADRSRDPKADRSKVASAAFQPNAAARHCPSSGTRLTTRIHPGEPRGIASGRGGDFLADRRLRRRSKGLGRRSRNCANGGQTSKGNRSARKARERNLKQRSDAATNPWAGALVR